MSEKINKTSLTKPLTMKITTNLFKLLFYTFFSLTIILIFVNLLKPAFWDEIGWLHGAYYFGNNIKVIYLSETGLKGLGLWYPSLYFFFIKLAAINFERIEVGIRLVNILCFVFSVFFLFKTCMQIFKNRLWSYFLVLIYCTTPFIVQGILLIEIDTSILSLAVIYSLYIILKSIELFGKITFKTEIIVYVLIALSKIIFLPIIVLSVVLFNFFIDKNVFKAFISAFSLLISGTIAMLIWIFFCKLNNADPYYFITFMHKRAGDSGSFLSINQFKEASVGVFRKSIWLTPYFFLLFIHSIYYFFINKVIKNNPAILFTTILTVIAFMMYIYIGLDAAGYPKYLYPVIAPAFILIVYFIRELCIKRLPPISELSVGNLLAWMVVFAVIVYFIGDPIKNVITYKYGRNLYWGNQALIKAILLKLYLTVAAYILVPVVFFYYINIKIRSVYTSISLALIIALITFNISLYAKQAYTSKSTLYMYSLEGVNETVNSFRSDIASHTNNILPAEIAYYQSKAQRYYELDGLLQAGSFLEIIKKERPELIVLRDQNWGDNDRVKQIRFFITTYNKEYKLTKIKGYQIYKRL